MEFDVHNRDNWNNNSAYHNNKAYFVIYKIIKWTLLIFLDVKWSEFSWATDSQVECFSPRPGLCCSEASICSACRSIRRGFSGPGRARARMFGWRKETAGGDLLVASQRWITAQDSPTFLRVRAWDIWKWTCWPSWCPSCSRPSTFAASWWARCQPR